MIEEIWQGAQAIALVLNARLRIEKAAAREGNLIDAADVTPAADAGSRRLRCAVKVSEEERCRLRRALGSRSALEGRETAPGCSDRRV